MFFGRIVCKGKPEGVPFYIEVTEKYVDDGLPTLVVGKKRSIELFGKENIKVLDRKINENVSWQKCFSWGILCNISTKWY